jgi:hypothetical protein
MLHSEFEMDNTLLQTMQSLERRAEKLEREAAALRRDLKQVVLDMANPEAIVATYEIGDETIAITQGEVEAVRARLTRPRAENVVREVALAYKLAATLPTLTPEEETEQLLRLFEEFRADALENGAAIDEDDLTALLDGD